MSSIIQNNTLSVISPALQKSIATLECSSVDEVLNIINTAKGYTNWKELPLRKRCNNINKFRKAILKNQDELKQIIKSETSKKDFDILIELPILQAQGFLCKHHQYIYLYNHSYLIIVS